jgi:hypothetical protein
MPDGITEPDETAADLDQWCLRHLEKNHGARHNARHDGIEDRRVSVNLPEHTPVTEMNSLTRTAAYFIQRGHRRRRRSGTPTRLQEGTDDQAQPGEDIVPEPTDVGETMSEPARKSQGDRLRQRVAGWAMAATSRAVSAMSMPRRGTQSGIVGPVPV